MKLKKSIEDKIDEDDYGRLTRSVCIYTQRRKYFQNGKKLNPRGRVSIGVLIIAVLSMKISKSFVIMLKRLFIYGGYETNEGIFDDFNSLPLPNSGKPFHWNNIEKKSENRRPDGNDEVPGPLRNHTAAVHETKMYIFGGKENLLSPTGKLWIFDFTEYLWTYGGECEIDGKQLQVEGHSCVVWNKENQPQLIVFGGFYGDLGYASSVLSYDIQAKQWTQMFDGFKESPGTPLKRAESGTLLIGKEVFIFGGCNLDVRFGDFWKFDLESKTWGLITTEKSPGTRSSTILVPHPQGILLFGGIHDITHEKNDVWIYKGNDWVVMEEDNSRKQVGEDQLNDSVADKASQGKAKKDKGKEMQNRSFLLFDDDNNKTMGFSPKRNSLRNIQLPNQKQPTESMNNSVTNNMDEQKKRRLQQKKMQMLAEFELTEEEKVKFRNSSPTTEQIKNSINNITKQEKSNIPQRKAMSPVGRKQQIQVQLQGKKPCARDGHSGVVSGDYMIIFGGDRNLMSFNDMYLYSLQK